MWRNVAPLVNEVDFYLNSYHDSCARITKVDIYVAQFVHLDLCLLVALVS